MDVGFIGVGRMGRVMVRNLLRAGHRVRGWDVSAAALDEIRQHGAETAASAHDAFRGDAVISMLPNDEAMRACFLDGGILKQGGAPDPRQHGDRFDRVHRRARGRARGERGDLYLGDGVRPARDGGRAQPQHHGGGRPAGDRAGAAVVRRHGPQDLAPRRRAAQLQRHQDRRQPDGRLHPRGDGGSGGAGARLQDAARRRARHGGRLDLRRAGLPHLCGPDQQRKIRAAGIRPAAGPQGRQACARRRRGGQRAAAVRQRPARQLSGRPRARRREQGLVGDVAGGGPPRRARGLRRAAARA